MCDGEPARAGPIERDRDSDVIYRGYLHDCISTDMRGEFCHLFIPADEHCPVIGGGLCGLN